MANGSITSFNNTPQAKDDVFLASWSGLTEDNLITHSLVLDVMANDLGGNAKSLYSLDDGVNSAGTSGDLLSRDAVGAANYSLNGATIRITADGKVTYDASTLTSAFKSQLNQLSAGEFATESKRSPLATSSTPKRKGPLLRWKLSAPKSRARRGSQVPVAASVACWWVASAFNR